LSAHYGEDLAYIHHLGFGDFARQAAPGLLAALRGAGIEDGLVVDLGCGGGHWLRELMGAGYAGCGIDISAAAIELARASAPGAELRVGSAHTCELPACAAVTALGEVLGYATEEDETADVGRTFGRVYRALRPGGLFVFDLLVREAGSGMAYRDWRAGEDWAVLSEVREDHDRHIVTRDITTFRAFGRGYRRSHEMHVQHVFAADEVDRALGACGFEVRRGRHYGALELAPRRMAFEARKPAARS
jgi:SAM-dependent methyltransferase